MTVGIKDLPSIFLLLEENFSISIIDREGIITYVNQKFCEISKYEAEELVGYSYDILNPTFADMAIHKFEQELTIKKVTQRKIKRFSKDGMPYWVQTTIVPILDEENQIVQFISFDIDFTNKVLTEKKYKKALEDLHNIQHALNRSTVVGITDQRGIITYVNDKFCNLSKYSAEELIGQTHQIVNSGYHPKSFFKDMWRTIGTGEIWHGEVKNRAKDGIEYWVNTTIVPFLNEKNKPYRYVTIRTDITSKKEAEHSLEIALKNDFRQTVKNLQNVIFKYRYTANDRITFTLIEGKTAEKLGITVEAIQKNEVEHTFSANEIKKFESYLKAGLRGEVIQFELNFFNHTFLVYLSPIFENEEVIEVVGTAIDISKRKKAEQLVEKMAYYDYLTELPNRRLFQMTVKGQLMRSERENSPFAIMFIDLDRFKNINDSLGHSIGDQLLKVVGERLVNCVRKDDMVARHGGDEYVILLSPANASEARTVAKRIMVELAKPFIFRNNELFVSSSIGISVFPEDGKDYETLTRNADSAMYLAKESGKNNYQFFTKKLHAEIVEKSSLEMALRQALANDQFSLHYQPQINLKTGALTGLEALIRWHHPTKGMISPAQFIPIAEETGLIVPIGQWVLETACAQMKKWQNDGVQPIQISVNVSIRQFKQSFFVEQVKEALIKTELQPAYLNLEITESMTADVHNCQLVLHQLRAVGINVSIDDFGTGYSSLSNLSKFPITDLKIDQAFVQELCADNQAIVKTIISLAKNLNINVIAEGVETEEQAHFLHELDCDEAQGYFYSKPLPLEQIEPFLSGFTF